MSFKWYGNKVINNVIKQVTDALNDSGDFYVREIKQSFKPGHWRRWRSKLKDQKYHWSSEIGQPPSVDTGNLKDNVFHRVVKSPSNIKLQIGISLKKVIYARAMEFGLPQKKVAPRPWLRPAFQRIKKVINRDIRNGIRI